MPAKNDPYSRLRGRTFPTESMKKLSKGEFAIGVDLRPRLKVTI